MNKRLILLCIFICCIQIVGAQRRHATKNTFRPGVSIGYLPGWLHDRLEGNTSASLFMTGIYGHQEIWKESVFIMGVAYGKFNIGMQQEFTGILFPVKLQKYFTPDRKGLNLAFGIMGNYCKTCDEKGGGALLNEINYLLAVHSIKVNVGIQTILGPLFDDPSIYLGGQVQLIWHPQGVKDRH